MIQVLSSLRRPGGKIKKSLDRTVFDLVSYVIPVSYTHLDVYKRQNPGWMPRP